MGHVDTCGGSVIFDVLYTVRTKVQLQDCRHGEWPDQRGKSQFVLRPFVYADTK